MHEVLEIILPQVDDVEEAVAQIMSPFQEGNDDEEYGTTSQFWDFYVIGGRWAGHKMQAGLDQDKLNEFSEELNNRKVTVSSIQCGKQELSPASQIPMVDELWAEFFPEYKGRACPLFNHANDQYENDCLYGDVMRLKDVSMEVSSSRFMVANYNPANTGIDAMFMLSTSVWNGVNFEDTQWDGTLEKALALYEKRMENRNEVYVAKHTIKDDWIVVTVDYHS